MAKMVNVDSLKTILADVLTEDNSTSVIEGIMAVAEDYDEEAEAARISAAVEAAKAEAAKEYAAKLHNMFFNGPEEGASESVDDTEVDLADIEGTKEEVEDIFS